MNRIDALTWLAAPDGAPWNWEADGSALVWKDGTTVALRQEVLALFETLPFEETPPFEAYVLLLAACRGRSEVGADLLQGTPATRAARLGALLQAGSMQVIERAGTALGRIAALEPDLRRQLGARRLLAGFLTETGPEPNEHSEQWRESVRRVLIDGLVHELTPGPVGSEPLRALQAFAEALGGEEPLALRRRLRTGVDEPLRPAELPLRPAQQVRALLPRLAAQPEQAGLARAVRDILAALRLPRHVQPSDELSSSGAADIANQGPLDRLLLSELAHDDDVLAARLALREALYMRREPPATPPAGAFVVLLDAGLRMWGLPRVFGTAVGLALAALDERRERFSAYRALGGPAGGVAPVDLCSQAGVEAQLEKLEHSAHPGAALPAFFALPEFAPATGMATPEAVLVLTPETAADPEFQWRLAAQKRLPEALYFATVGRDGHFALTLYPTAGRSPACSARIDLASLLREPERLHNPSVRAQPPAFLRLRPAPLLLSTGAAVRAALTLRDGRLCGVTQRQEICTWRDAWRLRGARLHGRRLPPGSILFLREESDGRVLCIGRGLAKPVRIVHCELEQEKVESRVVDGPDGLHDVTASNSEEILLFHGDSELWAVDARSGEVLDRRSLNEGLREGEGRPVPPGTAAKLVRCGPTYYQTSAQLVAAVWDGRLRWIPLGDRADFLVVYPGRDGVLKAISSRKADGGKMGDFVEGKFVPRYLSFAHLKMDAFAGTSPDGKLFYCRSWQPGEAGVISNREGTVVGPHPPGRVEPNYFAFTGSTAPQRNLSRRFRSLGVTGQALVLVEGNGRHLDLAPVDARTGVSGLRRSNRTPLLARADFTEVQDPPSSVTWLRVARFAGGAEAFLDSRGLLHLRAGGNEMTLVLGVGPLSLWCADGKVTGQSFHLGEGESTLPREEARQRLLALIQAFAPPA